MPPCQSDRLLFAVRDGGGVFGLVLRQRNDASHTLYSRAAPAEEVDVPNMR